MKKMKFTFKIYTTILFLLFTAVSFAQEDTPEDFGDPADANPNDVGAAPIGDYIWILALLGFLIVFYKIYSKNKIAKNS